MPLKEETKKLIEETKKQFTPTQLDPKELEAWSRVTPLDVQQAQPVVTNEKFEDYNRLLGDKGPMDPIFNNLEDRAAYEQSNFEKLSKGIVRVGSKVAFEIAKMPGTLAGLGEFGVRAAQGEGLGAFADSVNNAWVQALNEAEESFNEDVLKVYTPDSVRDGNLWDNISSASFWATEGADGVGFLLSMFVPGQALKAAGVGKGLAKAAKLFKPGFKYGKKLTDTLDEYAAASVNTLFEAATEGVESIKGVEDALYNREFNNALKEGLDEETARLRADEYIKSPEVREIAGKAGYGTFKKNLAILLGPNILDQKWLFRGSATLGEAQGIIGKRAAQAATKSSDDILQGFQRLTNPQKWGRVGEKVAIGVGKEGFFEEGMQFAASELEKNRAIDPEAATNLLETYIDSMSDTDMQKSIFLGAVLGGIMGGIGGYNSAKREDEYLLGTEGKKRGAIGKALGLKDIEAKKGVIDLLKQNYIRRYATISDIYEKKDGKFVLGEDNLPKPNYAKLKELGFDLFFDRQRQEQMMDLAIAEEQGNREGYEYVKANMDLRYMMPYMEYEGGYDLLKAHINTLAESELKEMQSTGMFDGATVEEVKQQLLDRASKINKLYKETENRVPSLFKHSREDSEYADMFRQKMFDSYLSTLYAKDYLSTRGKEIKKETDNILKDAVRYENIERTAQIRKGELIEFNGQIQQVTRRKGESVTFRDSNGAESVSTIPLLKEGGAKLVRGINPVKRNDLFNKLELLDNMNKDVIMFEENLETIMDKKSQQEAFDQYLAENKKAVREANKVKNKKTDEDLTNAKTSKDVDKTIAEQPDQSSKTRAKKKSSELADKEIAKNDIPNEEPKDDFMPEDDGEVNVDPNDIVKQQGDLVDKWYKNKPHNTNRSMRKLLGDPDKKGKDKEGVIMAAINEAAQQGVFDKEDTLDIGGVNAEFFSVKTEYDQSDEKDKVFIDFITKFEKGEIITDPNERAIIQSLLDSHVEEMTQAAKMQQETSTPEAVEEYETDNTDEGMTPEDMEAYHDQFVERYIYKDTFGVKGIEAFSHDHTLERVLHEDIFEHYVRKNLSKYDSSVAEAIKDVEVGNVDEFMTAFYKGVDGEISNEIINGFLKTKESFVKNRLNYKLARDVNGNPILRDMSWYGKEYWEGRDLINSGKIKEGAVLKFKVDPFSKYNSQNNNRSNPNKFDIKIYTEYNGRDVMIGLVPAIHSEKSNAGMYAKALREAIHEEMVKGDHKTEFTSVYQSKIQRFKLGKIMITESKIKPSDIKLSGDKYVSVVVNKAGTKIYEVGETVPGDVTKSRFAAHGQQSGVVHIWVKHPTMDSYVPVRAFTKKLGEDTKLKNQVIDKLKRITSEESAKVVLADIKKNDAILDFRYNEADGTITPREKVKGKWSEKEILPAFKLSEIDSSDSARLWLDNAAMQINKSMINKGDYNEKVVNERVTLNTLPSVFSDINFLFDPNYTKGKVKVEPKPVVKKPVEPVVKKPVEEKLPEPIDTLAAKKNDIEKRRQKELASIPSEEEAKRRFIQLRIKYNSDIKPGDERQTRASNMNAVKSNPKGWVLPEDEKEAQRLAKIIDQYLWSKSPRIISGIEILGDTPQQVINKKYDAELAELTKKEPKAKPRVEIDPKRVSPRRRFNKGGKARLAGSSNYTKWNQAEETQWFKERFPGVPLHVVDNIKRTLQWDKELWGLFKNASVYIADNAATGTAYHEAFHVVFNMYLDESQQKDLTKDMTEEQLADKFMEYVQGRIGERSLGQKILDFFKNLWNYIQYIATGNLNEGVVFNRIQTKYYNKMPFTKNVSEFNSNLYTRERAVSVPGAWTRRDIVLQARAMNSFMLNYSLPYMREITEEYKNLDDIELILTLGNGNARQGLFEAYKDVLLQIESSRDEIAEEDIELFNNLVDTLHEDIATGVARPGSIINQALRDLNNYGIKVIGRSIEEVPEDDEQAISYTEDVGFTETWQVEYAQRNSKNNVPYEVKRYIRNLHRVDPNNPDAILTDVVGALPAPVDYDVFYDTIMKDVSHEDTIEGMITNLEVLSDIRPEYATIVEDLRNNNELATKFFATFNKPEVMQIFINEVTKGSKTSDMIVSISNSRGIERKIIARWQNGIQEAGYLENAANANQLRLRLQNNANRHVYDIEDSKEIARLLREAGIEIPSGFIHNLFNRKDAKAVNDFVGKMMSVIHAYTGLDKNKGKYDPFVGENKESRILNALANEVKEVEELLTQPSFTSAQGNKVYAHLEGNFAIRLINRIKKSKPSMESTIDGYSKDPFFNEAGIIFKELRKMDNPLPVMNSMGYGVLDAIRMANETQATDFANLDDTKLKSTTLSLFVNNGNKNEAWYRMFVVSDATAMPLFRFTRRGIDTGKNNILDSLVKIARAEVNNIRRIRQRLDNLEPNQLIKNHDTEANASYTSGFHLLRFLNESGINWDNKDLTDKGTATNPNNDWIDVREYIESVLDKRAELYAAELKDAGIIKEAKQGSKHKWDPVSGFFPGKAIDLYGSVDNAIREFYYNDFFMRTQTTLMMLGNPAFYKADGINNPVIDLQKRSKESYSPRGLLDLTATFNGRGIKKSYKGITLRDNEFYSNRADAIYENLKQTMTDKEAMKIAAMYGYSNDTYKGKPIARYNENEFFKSRTINQTDAQAYITLDFYKDTMVGAGRWTQKHEDAFTRLKAKKGTSEDIQVILQPFKPFTYGIRQLNQEKLELKGKETVATFTDTINVPTQHKNSEYVLIPQLMDNADDMMKNLYNVMVDENGNSKIDIVNFESGVKVGNIGMADATNPQDAVVDNYSMSDRGLQQEVPEHFIDASNLYGTQFRALIMSNLEGKYIINENTKEPISKDAKDLYALYNDLIVSNIEESYNNFADEFGLNEELIKSELKDAGKEITDKSVKLARLYKIRDLILTEIRDRGMSEQYEKAIQVDEANERFAIPLFHPIHSVKIESLITALFKNKMVKQKINGGSFVQVSNFGFTDKLNLEIEDGRIKHAEVMLPMWSKELFKPYMNKNGSVDVARIEKEAPDLLEGIGYRIPTEDKYSMIPLKVVGFLPQEAGGVVMLPAEITTISGSDFDVDKMYVMLPEGKTRWDYNKVNRTLEGTHRNLLKAGKVSVPIGDKTNYDIKRILELVDRGSQLDSTDEFIYRLFNKVYPNGVPGSSSKIRYDYTKTASENETSARNNALLDISWSVLTNSNTFKDFINPGGFDRLKNYSKKMQLFQSGVSMKRILAAEENGTLDALYEEEGNKEHLDFMDPLSQDELTKRNMVGVQLKGIAANHNKAHAVRLWTNMYSTVPVVFNGNNLTSLNGKSNKGLDTEGVSISRNFAEPLAAIMDNAKDPVSGFVNYNMVTADVVSFILATGHSLDTAMAFINQPVVKEIVRELETSPIGDELTILRKHALRAGYKDVFKVKPKDLSTKELWDNFDNQSENVDMRVIQSFIAYKIVAKEFSRSIRAMRADTQGGAPGPELTSSTRKKDTIKNALKNDKIKGIDEVITSDVRNSNVPYLAAFTEYSLNKSIEFMDPYFPNNSRMFDHVRERIGDYIEGDLTEKQIRYVNQSLTSYMLSGGRFYNIENKSEFVRNFPRRFFRLSKRDSGFAQNILVKMIDHQSADRKSPIEYLSFSSSMELSPEQRDTIIDNFRDMLNDNRKIVEHADFKIKDKQKNLDELGIDENTTYADIARDLIRYSFYSSGFNFGPNSFFNLVPVEFYTETTEGMELIDDAYNMLEEIKSVNNEEVNRFLNQFYRNSHKRGDFVPSVKMDDKKKPVGFREVTENEGTVLVPTEGSDYMQRRIQTDLGTVTEFVPYMNYKDAIAQYDSNSGVYFVVEKLGIPNILLEYDRNNDLDASVVKVSKDKGHAAKVGFAQDPDVKEKIFGNDVSTTMSRALGRIAYSEHPLNGLAHKLWEYSQRAEELGINVPVHLATTQALENAFDVEKDTPGLYSHRHNSIYMTVDGMYQGKNAETTLIHEAIHALTVFALQTDSEYAKDFEAMYEYARSNTKNKGLYGYKDVYEFASTLMTDSRMIKDLKSMTPSSDIRRYRNLFEEIVSKILEFLGINIGESAYDQAVSILSNVVHYGQVDLSNRAIAQASRLDEHFGLSRDGKRFYRGYEKSAEIAKDLNNNQLKNSNFVAKRIKFMRNNKEVWGVKIEPKNIVSRMDVEASGIMFSSEMEAAFRQISDEDAINQQKICE